MAFIHVSDKHKHHDKQFLFMNKSVLTNNNIIINKIYLQMPT